MIGGVWRRLRLPIAPVEGLRPSPDRVRETVFNWLGQDCSGWRVLDLFAGTGALGFEAASRGARDVQFVESHRVVAAQLAKNANHLLSKWSPDEPANPPRIDIVHTDVGGFLARDFPPAHQFDVVFADPPFRTDWMDKLLPCLARMVKPNGLVYLEWNESLFELPRTRKGELGAVTLSERMKLDKIDALRHLKAGQVHAHLVRLPAVC